MTGSVPSKQDGIALITAMLVVFLATFAASDLAYRVQLAINRSAVILGQRQALYYAVGVEQWAAEILRRDAADNDTDHAGEDWAKPFAELPIEGGKISGYIADEQGRFNVNALVGAEGGVNEAQLGRLRTLLRSLGADENIAAAVADWIDADENEAVDIGSGAESLYYMTLKPPYRAANGPMSHVSEMRLVKGIDAKVFEALRPHLTALPVGQGTAVINVNAATVPMLMALSPELGEADAKALHEEAANTAFDSVDSFLAHSAIARLDLDAGSLAVASRFFRVHAEVQTEYGHARIVTLIERVPDGPVRVVRREMGGPV